MKSKALTLGVVSVALAAGTFFVLNKIAPQKHVEEKRTQQGPTVDEVFAGSLNLAAAESDAPPASAPADGAAPADAAAEPAVDATEGGEMASETAAPMDAPAAEAMPAETAASGDMGAVESSAAPAAAPAAEAEPAPAPAASEPPPTAAPTAEPEPEPAPAAEAPKPKPAAKPVEKKKPAAKQPVVAWWTGESATSLSLVYAGSAAYKKAVVLMFSGSFDSTDSATKNIQVQDANGKTVSGQWELGASNPRMLVFPVQKSGRYKVVVNSDLTDRNKRKLGRTLLGPVQVQ